MVSQHGVDTDKLQALLSDMRAAESYKTWLDNFIIPLLKKIGLRVTVRRNPASYVITVTLPNAKSSS